MSHLEKSRHRTRLTLRMWTAGDFHEVSQAFVSWALSTPAQTLQVVPYGGGGAAAAPSNLRDNSSSRQRGLVCPWLLVTFSMNPQLPPDLTQGCSVLPGWGSLTIDSLPQGISARMPSPSAGLAAYIPRIVLGKHQEPKTTHFQESPHSV